MTDTEVKIKRTKAYLVQVSRGEPVKIDDEELPKVIAALESGRVCILKQGIINPSYVTSVIPDKDRIEAYLHDLNHYGDKYAREHGMKALPELINRDEVLKQLGAPEHKRLGKG